MQTDILDVPEHVKAALQVFSVEEQKLLTANFMENAGNEVSEHTFIGIGFTGPGGRFTKFAEPSKYRALQVLDAQMLAELREIF